MALYFGELCVHIRLFCDLIARHRPLQCDYISTSVLQVGIHLGFYWNAIR